MTTKKTKAVLLMMAVLLVLSVAIYGLSERVQSQMEQTATANVREIVQVLEMSVAEIRRSDAAVTVGLAAGLPLDGDVGAWLSRVQADSPFQRLSYVPAGSDVGISSDGGAYIPVEPRESAWGDEEYRLGAVHMGDMGAWTYTVECPVRRETGVPAGTLYADVVMERYDDILPGTVFQGEGQIYLLDADSLRFIYEPASTSMFVASKYDLHGFLSEYGLLTDETLEQTITGAIGGRESAIIRMRIKGEGTYLYFWPVDSGDWYLCGIIPEQSILREGKSVTLTILAVSILIFGTAVLIFLMFFWNARKERKARQYQIDLFNGISRSIDDVVLLYDRKTGKLELAFDNIKRVLGLDSEELARLLAATALSAPYQDEPLFRALRLEAIPQDEGDFEKIVWRNPVSGDGQFLRVEFTSLALSGVEKWIVSIRDITKDEQMRESLRASMLAAQNASRVKSDFLSRMSHEIRTPMNAVLGMAQIAKTRLDDQERVADCLGKIEGSSKHLLGLINDILDISKIESQKLSLSEDWFDLDSLLSEVSTVTSVQAGLRRQRFAVENKAGPLELLGDQVRLNQVLTNLLSNSVKYTPEGGSVSLSVELGGSQSGEYQMLHFRVQDNGIGMSAEFQKKLFNPFEREDDDKAVNSQTGTGLGLAIVQSMVSLMGGSIRVASEKGVGTTFVVDIAFKCKSAERVPEREDASAEVCDLTGMVILLAEDNELNREIAVEFLRMAGAQVKCAVDGRDAFEKFRDAGPYHYHLILMDVQMPRWDGLEAARQIRRLDLPDAPTIPIIAVTANAYSEDAQRCLDAGMNGHISKPLDMQEFYRKVRQYLPGKSKEEATT